MFERVLVPLDGSLRAERAIPVAARIARTSSATVILLRVVEIATEFMPYFIQPSHTLDHIVEQHLVEARDYLQQVAQDESLRGLSVQIEVLEGTADLKLYEAIETYGADLVVMCSHGYTGFKRWMLGSVTDKTARHSHVPLLILHEQGRTSLVPTMQNAFPLPALVSLDGSALSEAALLPTLDLLMALAPDTPKALHLLRVIDLPTAFGIGKSSAHLGVEVIARAESVALEYVEALAQKLRQQVPERADFTITSSVVVDTDVAGTIINATEPDRDGKSAYQLVAMATHGLSGVRHWVMGSVTERVLHSTTLPLFIVRPQVIKKPQEEKAQEVAAVAQTQTTKAGKMIPWDA